MNDENLVSLRDRTTSEQREIARKGGIASSAARRKKKTDRELLELILDGRTRKGPETDIEELSGELTAESIEGANFSLRAQILLALVNRARKGDIRAIDCIMRMKGELVQKHEIKASVETVDQRIIDDVIKELDADRKAKD